MKQLILTLHVVALVAFAGCTPSGENIARKAELDVTTGSWSMSGQGRLAQLDSKTDRVVRKYGPMIKRYSERYGFDWRLVLAVMKQESRFSRTAQSHKGAAGLMQIMPVTGEELARKLDLDDLSHPENNIQGGIFYLKGLYELFEGASESDRIKLTLAAYNAGISRIYDAQEVAAYLHEKPTQWQAVRDALPFLSKRYYTLHQNVWQQEKPKSGWFGNAKETIRYVESVMDYYDEFRGVLN